MKILLKGNICIGIATEEHPVHPSLTWMDWQGATPRISDTWNGVSFDPKPGPTSAELDAEADAATDRIFVNDKTLKAFALVLLDEINLLRTEHALALRTDTQLRNAVRTKRRGL